jgi:hypothetical protein
MSGRLVGQGDRDLSAAGPHDHTVSPDLGGSARGHRRRSVLAGQRRIEKRYGCRDLDRSGHDSILSQAMNRAIDSATAAGFSEPSTSTVVVIVACTAPSSGAMLLISARARILAPTGTGVRKRTLL